MCHVKLSDQFSLASFSHSVNQIGEPISGLSTICTLIRMHILMHSSDMPLTALPFAIYLLNLHNSIDSQCNSSFILCA